MFVWEDVEVVNVVVVEVVEDGVMVVFVGGVIMVYGVDVDGIVKEEERRLEVERGNVGEIEIGV